MMSLYVSHQGCYISLKKETVIVKCKEEILAEVQIPLLEQIYIFGKSQVTTQVIRKCLKCNIPIVYLSRMGYCYGRILPIERGYRQLIRYQQELILPEKLMTARAIIQGKLKNCRVILQRQYRRLASEKISFAIKNLEYFLEKAQKAESIDKLIGYEGTSASIYFSALEESFTNSGFVFLGRSRRPPGNPVNALLSFGYQLLWNHLLTLIEVEGLDPYLACLHSGHRGHAALASDLIEEFRAPIIDSLVLWLINTNYINPKGDFEIKNEGCYLNSYGRQKYLKAFAQKMEEKVKNNQGDRQPRWSLLSQQVKLYKQFVYNPGQGYQPYLIR